MITIGNAPGHSHACTRVVGDTPMMFDHGRVPAPATVGTP